MRRLPLLLVALLLCHGLPARAADFLRAPAGDRTPLDDYVAQPDPSYAWKVAGTSQLPGLKRVVVDLTSQTWRTTDDVNRTVWKHWLVLYVPDGVTADTALLFIGGGGNSEQPPAEPNGMLAQVALATKTVVAELPTVPNQPLVFDGDGEERHEDGILAYTWEQFLESGDPTWIGQLPMTKSAVRAMDTVQAVVKQEQLAPAVERFVVTGGSKRGWTTWLTAAVDTRVRAIAPLVIDVLNIADSMPHHFGAYGEWAPSLDDYVRHGLPDRLDDPECEKLLQIVDPYHYRTRLTMPKCIVNSTGDEFFLPDSSRFYYDDLQGPKHLCYVPNVGHSLKGSTAPETLTAFHHAVVNGHAIPSVTWQPAGKGWRVETTLPATKAIVWQATNPEGRDFRVTTIGQAYQPRELPAESDGSYVVHPTTPVDGYAATFVELAFDVGAPAPLRLTTPVWVTPDTLPFARERQLEAVGAGGE